MKYQDFFLLTFAIMLILSGTAHAVKNSTSYPTASFHLTQHNYSGEKNKSFGESPTGYAIGVNILTQREYIVPYVGVNYGAQNGKQSFLDGTTVFSSNYNYQYASGEFGIYFFPIGRCDRGLNVYINGAGLGSYNSLSLKTSTTLTNIPKSEQNFGTGYKGNVGFEWILQTRGTRTKWTAYAEIGFKKETVKLLKQNFNLDTLNYSVGLGW